MTAEQIAGGKDVPANIAFYMTGNSAKVIRRCMDFLDMKTIALCPNFQSYEESLKEPKFASVDYLYQGFNELFDRVDVAAFCRKYSSVNLAEVLTVDKSHYKRQSSDYRLRYACTMGTKIAAVLEKWRPEYLFFPIIENIDTMLAYRLALHYGIKPIVYCHTRFSGRSFFSESHIELIPSYAENIPCSPENAAGAAAFLERYLANPGNLLMYPEESDDEMYSEINEEHGAFGRLMRNLRLKFGPEKHNRLINIWVSFQVRFQKIILPIRAAIYNLLEKYYLKPKAPPSTDYDYFPLHMSPEASINVPAPFFIDQIRVVDKILLDRRGNRPLVVKEHPAMFGYRPVSFFRDLKKRPFVTIVPRTTSSIDLIRRATTVYSVTGTACLEAFLLGVPWVQYGTNFLLDWIERRKSANQPVTPLAFIQDVYKVSGDFLLYSPNRSTYYDRFLFSKNNVEKLSRHIEFHIAQVSMRDRKAA